MVLIAEICNQTFLLVRKREFVTNFLQSSVAQNRKFIILLKIQNSCKSDTLQELTLLCREEHSSILYSPLMRSNSCLIYATVKELKEPSASFLAPLNHLLSPIWTLRMYKSPLDTVATRRWWRPPSSPSAVRVRTSYL